MNITCYYIPRRVKMQPEITNLNIRSCTEPTAVHAFTFYGLLQN